MFYFTVHGSTMPFYLSQKPHHVHRVIPKQPSAFNRMEAKRLYALLFRCLFTTHMKRSTS